jgi:hypothetical protein
MNVVGMTQFGFTQNTYFILLPYFAISMSLFFNILNLSVGKSKNIPSLRNDTRAHRIH